MLLRSTVPVLGLAFFLGCAAPATTDDPLSDSSNALSGNVATGMVTKTTTDGLRLRKTPDKSSTANVVGLIPIGTQVKILDGKPTNGFYKLQILDAALKKKLAVDMGWVYGDYLDGKAIDDDDGLGGTGSHDVATVMSVKWVQSDCKDLTDDKGHVMAPSIDDYLTTSGHAFAVIGIDTDTFSYGSTASIDEVDQASSFNPGGVKVPLKIVKTAKTQPDGPFTVTLCMNAASKMILPTDADGLLTLRVE